MKTSLVVTVLNEEGTIRKLLSSIDTQTLLPKEVIIVDGGSKDKTKHLVSNFKFLQFKGKIKLITRKGNRSIGRNYGISRSTNQIILITDAGCILDKNWVKNITEPFSTNNVEVVAGYYKAKTESVFQKCIASYVLVMPDKIDPDIFLPASRSMAFKKSAWRKNGKFPEEYSHNEDYIFARKLKKNNTKIVFKKNAIVYWIPRKNIHEAFIMFFRFAYGDAQARLIRPKVLLLIARYLFFFGILMYSIMYKLEIVQTILLGFTAIYIVWSITKNYKYVKHVHAIYILPILQLLSDLSVLLGTFIGFLNVKKIKPT